MTTEFWEWLPWPLRLLGLWTLFFVLIFGWVSLLEWAAFVINPILGYH